MTNRLSSPKKYKCQRCGHVQEITTNHYGKCWSWGRSNTCPKCPPWAKYSEFGGQTIWICIEEETRNGEADDAVSQGAETQK